MADNDELNLDDGGSAAPAKKGGGLGGALSGMLKWIIIAVAAVILIVVVVVVTIKLASSNTSNATSIPIGEEYTQKRELLDYYTSLGVIQTFTSDDPPASVRVNVLLGYKKDGKEISAEITARSVELKDFLRQYFSGKTAAEIRNVNNEERLKIELKNAINDRVLSSTKISNVIFEQKDVIQQ